VNSRLKRGVSGGIVAAVACSVYAWSVIGAFAHPTATQSASALAYQYSNGHVNGGGHIIGKSVHFEFEAKSNTNGIKGQCKVSEEKTDEIKCLTIASLAVVGTHATFSGTARHNGVETTFTIDVDDLAKEGKGHDQFAISLGDGYSRSGVLSDGNVEIH